MEKFEIRRQRGNRGEVKRSLHYMTKVAVIGFVLQFLVTMICLTCFAAPRPLWEIVPDYQPPASFQAAYTELAFVDIHLDLLRTRGGYVESITFPLFSRTFEAIKTQVDITMTDPLHYVWYGRIQSETEGFVILASGSPDSLHGYIFVDGRTYYIDPMRGTTIHALYRPQRIEPEGMGSDAALPSESLIPPLPPTLGGGTRMAEDGSVINLLVYYTTGLEQAPGDINELIDRLVGIANQSLKNSGAGTTINVVYRQEALNYTNGDRPQDHVWYLQQGSRYGTGPFAELKDLRNRYAADMVTLLRLNVYTNPLPPYPFCGWAYYLDNAENSPFSVVQVGSTPAMGCYDETLAHELGHGLGCGHNPSPEEQYPWGYYWYSHAHVLEGLPYRTIVSYGTAPGQEIIPYYSNPDVQFQGVPTGTATRNNALTIYNTRDDVANFRAKEPIYRFWSPVYYSHHYTIWEWEKNYIIEHYPDVWAYEGIAWWTYANWKPGLEEVYRLWNQSYLCHGFTINEAEYQSWKNSGWSDEGVGWYDYPYQASGTLPVYRFWSPIYTAYFYTISEAEKNFIIANYSYWWTFQGVVWYSYAAP